MEVQGKAASTDVESTSSDPENLAKIIEVATLNNRFALEMKQLSIGRRCHLGLS